MIRKVDMPNEKMNLKSNVLTMITGKKHIVCSNCKKSFPAKLPACPHCTAINKDAFIKY